MATRNCHFVGDLKIVQGKLKEINNPFLSNLILYDLDNIILELKNNQRHQGEKDSSYNREGNTPF